MPSNPSALIVLPENLRLFPGVINKALVGLIVMSPEISKSTETDIVLFISVLAHL